MFEFNTVRPKAIISLTPLIDVVFILLLFFMLATKFDTEHAFAVGAVSGSAEHFVSDSPGKLHLLDEQTLSLDSVVLDEYAVKQELLKRYYENQSYAVSVSVSVASGISVQSLLELILLIKKTGIQRITIESNTGASTQ